MPVQRANQSTRERWPRFAVLIGLGLAVAGIMIAKNYASPSASMGLVDSVTRIVAADTDLPEAQLAQLLADKRPTLAFFHSDTCYQCTEMLKIVNQVYPEFTQSVALVDVNVYDQRNAQLLQRAQIRAIPTLIFFDRSGQGQVFLGVMQPDQLRQQLQTISGGQ